MHSTENEPRSTKSPLNSCTRESAASHTDPLVHQSRYVGVLLARQPVHVEDVAQVEVLPVDVAANRELRLRGHVDLHEALELAQVVLDLFEDLERREMSLRTVAMGVCVCHTISANFRWSFFCCLKCWIRWSMNDSVTT